jgi:endonuclease VIII
LLPGTGTPPPGFPARVPCGYHDERHAPPGAAACMPEGDTIHRTAATLQRALGGQRVIRFETGYAHLARVDDDRPIAGRIVERVEAAGKHVLVVLSGDLVLRTHMRMNGAWHLYRHRERWRVPARAVRIRLDTAEWVALAVDVPVADFVAAAQISRHASLARLGPDLLGEAFDAPAIAALWRAAGARVIGDVLLDQRVVAGLGNVLRCEVLFMSGVHPDRPAGTIPDDTLATLVTAARRVMRSSRASGDRRTTARLNPDARLWVYGRTDRPCRQCATPIRSRKAGPDQRAVYWCPRCQPTP